MKENLEKILELFNTVSTNKNDTVTQLELMTLLLKTINLVEDGEKVTEQDLAIFNTDEKRTELIAAWLAGLCLAAQMIK